MSTEVSHLPFWNIKMVERVLTYFRGSVSIIAKAITPAIKNKTT